MPTWELHITGRVQGVGFRPHVYRLARTLGLRGEVCNGNDGVRIVFKGHSILAQELKERLLADSPPRAMITAHTLKRVAEREFADFSIVGSSDDGAPDLLVSPDFALCPECRYEISDSRNRRFGYAFTTCTNCGPRYALLDALPYDRERTTMAGFEQCPTCQSEYNDPTDRRYFSQTNSCADCGPCLRIYATNSGNESKAEESTQKVSSIISQAAQRLGQGKIVAVKGTGGYLLCCDARATAAVAELRRRKARPEKPFAVLFADQASVKSYARLSPAATEELTSAAAPIVLLPKGSSQSRHHELAPNLAPASHYLGAMLPNSALLALLAEDFAGPLVATSANLSGEPILSEGQEDRLNGLADYILTHNLPIVQPQDDSLVRFTAGAKRRIVLRRGRGLAPALLPPATDRQDPGRLAAIPDLLAMGADLKAGIGIRAHGRSYLSPYLGDLADYGSHERYRATLARLLQLTGAQPELIITDLHPAYFSGELGRSLAEERNLPVHTVQHHEAHFAALLGEHDLLGAAENILGVIWDGTGLGHDGQIWGGEFLRFDERDFRRVGHLPYFPHIGGDRMAREPRYAALALAGHLPAALPLLRAKFSAAELRNLLHLRSRPTLQTSSVGRLFDAVASLIGLRDVQDYEGQAATALEQLARQALADEPYLRAYAVDAWLSELLDDLEHTHPAVIAGRFHLTLAEWIHQIAEWEGVKAIACSGGVFQNALLVDLLEQHLGSAGYRLYFHEQLSPNDENLAYGQLIHYQCGLRPAAKPASHVLSYTG